MSELLLGQVVKAFEVTGRGTVAGVMLESDVVVRVGSRVRIKSSDGSRRIETVQSVDFIDYAGEKLENPTLPRVGILFKGLVKSQIPEGSLLYLLED